MFTPPPLLKMLGNFAAVQQQLAAARGLGLAITDRLPPFKRLFMDHALGLRSDLPPLARP